MYRDRETGHWEDSRWIKPEFTSPGFIGTYTDESEKKARLIRPIEEHEVKCFEAALEAYGSTKTIKVSEDGKEVRKPLVLVPFKLADVMEVTSRFGGTRSKMSCEFNAVRSFVSNLFGVGLDSEDSEWFQKNPLVGTNGVPMENTLRVAQELVAPYNLRISRVYVAPGLTTPGDLAQWMKVLGCNPLAAADKSTTNAEFATLSGMSLEEVNNLFRFEFNGALLRPAISCATGSGVTAEFGKGNADLGGHAEYRSPRAGNYGTPWLQFQMDRADRVMWLETPAFPEVAPEQEEKEKVKLRVSLYMSKTPEGKLLSSTINWTDGRSSTQVQRDFSFNEGTRAIADKGDKIVKEGRIITTTRQVEHRKGGAVIISPEANMTVGDCLVCETKETAIAVPHVCYKCWQALWRPFACISQLDSRNGCGIEFGDTPPYLLRLYKDTQVWKFEVECPGCHKVYALPVTDKQPLSEIVKNAFFGKLPSQQDYAIVRMLRSQT